MTEDTNDIIFGQETIDFVRAANSYCSLLENCNEVKKSELLTDLQRAVSEIYFRIVCIPEMESYLSEPNEKFVSESDWQNIHDILLGKLGGHNEFLEVMDERFGESDYAATVSLSEYLADIYQDLKDFILLFRIGNGDLMHDALWEVKQNFEEFWGQKCVNSLKAIHNLVSLSDLDDEDEE